MKWRVYQSDIFSLSIFKYFNLLFINIYVLYAFALVFLLYEKAVIEQSLYEVFTVIKLYLFLRSEFLRFSTDSRGLAYF